VAPSNLTGTVVSYSQINVSWPRSQDGIGQQYETVSGVKSYQLFRNGTNASNKIAEIGDPGVSYSDSGVTPNSLVFYAIRAMDNASNYSTFVISATVTTPAAPDTTAPTVPGSVSATAQNCGSVLVAWAASTDPAGPGQAVSGVKGYNIYRGGTLLTFVTGTSYTDGGLAGNAGYNYQVSAVDNAANASALSASAPVTTPLCPDTTPPTAPFAVVVNGVTCSSVQLSWQASSDPTTAGQTTSGVKGYNIYRGGVNVGFATTTTYTDSGLTGNTSYSYQVSAVDNANNTSALSGSASSSTATCTDTTPPTMPAGLTVNPVDCTSLMVSWQPSVDPTNGNQAASGVYGYRIYRGGYLYRFVTTTNLLETGLAGGTSYGYQVSAVDNALNESVISSLVYGTTPACAQVAGPATGLHLSFLNSGQIALNWSGTTGALYQAECALGISGPWEPVDAPTLNFGVNAFAQSPLSVYRVALFTNTPAYVSNVVANNGDKAPPSVPGNLTVTPLSDNSVTISWDPSIDYGTTDGSGQTYTSGLDAYYIYRDGVFLKVEPATSTNTTDAPTPFNIPLSYSVGAIDKAGNLSPLATNSIVMRPPGPGAPTGLTGSATSCSQVNLNWVAPSKTGSGLASYNVYRNGTLIQSVTATSWSDSTVAASTPYSYAVTAVDTSNRESSKSSSVSVTTPACADSIPPSIPTGLTGGAASCTQAGMSWNASTDTGGSGLKGYKVYRNGSYLTLVLAPTTSATDNTVTGNSVYYYAVSAIDNANNESSQSGSYTIVTPACTGNPPTVPTGLTGSAASCTNAILSWNPSTDLSGTGLSGYKIYRNGSLLTQVAAPGTNATDNGLSPSTSNLYSVSAVDNTGQESAQSGTITVTTPGCADTTPPSVPTGLTGGATTCTNAGLSWNASTDTGGSGLKGYNLYRNSIFVAQIAAPTTSYSDSGLNPSTSYIYTVAAIDNANNQSAQSGSFTVVTPACPDVIPPSVPTGLAASGTACTNTTLRWHASTDTGGSGLRGYNVYRNGSYLVQVLAPSTNLTDNTLTGSTTYSYAVSAVDNANNESAQSSSINVTTTACSDTTPPSVPTGLAGSATTCTNVNVHWNASTDTGGSGLKGYNLYRNGSLVTLVLAPTTSYTDSGLSGGTTNSYKVSAIDNANNQSAQSSAISVTTPACPDTTPPSVPSGLTVTATTCSNATLRWNASTDTGGSGLKGYNLYRNGTFVVQVLAPTTNATDSGLSASTIYTYTVSAVDNAGNASAQSSSANATTPACPDTTPPSVPSGLTVTATTCSNATLRWNASTDTGGSGMKGYNLYRNGTFIVQVLAPATNATDSGLSASATYTYTASAVDNAGNASAQSTSVNATTTACPDTTPPSVPSGVAGSATSCTNVNLHWNPSTDTGGSGLMGYNVYRNGAFIVQVLAPATNLTDTGLSGATSYGYMVSAVDNANNQSAQTATVNVTTPSCPCSYQASPTSISYSASGGNGTITVTATTNCVWTATSNVPWITITSGARGTNNGSVGYSVAVNSGSSALTGTMTVAGQTVTITEGGSGGVDSTPPSISISTPVSGTTVSGAVVVDANASDNVGVTSVQFYVDNLGSWVLIATQTGVGPGPADYTLNYNTTNVANGPHNFLCRAYDAAGNSSYTINAVTVTNYNADPGVLSWAKDAGVSPLTGEAQHTSVRADSQGNLIAVGKFIGTINYAGTSLTAVGGYDFFIAKFTPSGTLSWVRSYGGAFDNIASSVAVDGSDNIIITGEFAGSMNVGGGTLTSGGGNNGTDVFVAKYTPDGGHIWSKSFGGAYGNQANGVAVDKNNNVLVTGQYNFQADFGGGVVQSAGGQDGFVAKYSGTTGAYIWARSFGGSAYDDAEALAVDGNGDVWVSGFTTGNMDFGNGSQANGGGSDAFLAKFSGSTGTTIWAKMVGGVGNEDGSSLSVDGAGNGYLAGSFSQSLNLGIVTLSAPLSTAMFVAKFDASGNVAWTKAVGGQSSIGGNVSPRAAAVDSSGNVIVTGTVTGEADFGDGQLTAGTGDIFVAKYSGSGTYLWSKRYGTGGSGTGSGVTTDSSRNVVLAGTFTGTAIIDGTTLSSASVQTKDAILVKYTP
jgi:fibronectin type 3 domain-containing protein